MGALLGRNRREPICGSITLGKLMTSAKGGDLVLVQDLSYLDDYNRLNSQEAHFLKQLLRFKSKENPPAGRMVQPWSRVGIVLDSDVADLKFLLEISERGFQQNEFLSRMLQLKNDPELTVAVM